MRASERLVSLSLLLITFCAFAWMTIHKDWAAAIEAHGIILLTLVAFGYPVMVYLLPRAPALKKMAYLLVLVPTIYGAIGSIMRHHCTASMEAYLYAMDLRVGFNVFSWGANAMPIWLTETFGFFYLFYFPYLIGSSYRIMRKNDVLSERFFIGMVTTYTLGYLGYLMAPALGPRYSAPATFEPQGGFLAPLAIWIVGSMGSPWAVMPSMHVGATFYILGFDALHDKKRFLWFLLPVIGLAMSTTGLGFHYFSDVIMGIAVAVAGLWAQRNASLLLNNLSKPLAITPSTLITHNAPRLRRLPTMRPSKHLLAAETARRESTAYRPRLKLLKKSSFS